MQRMETPYYRILHLDYLSLGSLGKTNHFFCHRQKHLGIWNVLLWNLNGEIEIRPLDSECLIDGRLLGLILDALDRVPGQVFPSAVEPISGDCDWSKLHSPA